MYKLELDNSKRLFEIWHKVSISQSFNLFRTLRNGVISNMCKSFFSWPRVPGFTNGYYLSSSSTAKKRNEKLFCTRNIVVLWPPKTKEHLITNYIDLKKLFSSQEIQTQLDEPSNSDWGDPEAAKLVLHITNFSTIQKYDSILVLYHTSWCFHCRRIKKPYSQAALLMKEHNVPGQLAAMDVTSNDEVADQENIVGVPILKYYRKGRFIANYGGQRAPEAFFNFMKSPPTEAKQVHKVDL